MLSLVVLDTSLSISRKPGLPADYHMWPGRSTAKLPFPGSPSAVTGRFWLAIATQQATLTHVWLKSGLQEDVATLNKR